MNSKQSGSFSSINTQRLYLRKVKESDAETLFDLRSNEIVNQFILRPNPEGLKSIKTFIQDRISETNQGKVYYWAITKKGNENVIGTICLWNFSEGNSIAEIGYDLHPTYFKKGIMSEAMTSVIDFGFSTLHLKSIEAFTHRENISSINLLKRHHFILENNRIDRGFPKNIIFKLTTSKY